MNIVAQNDICSTKAKGAGSKQLTKYADPKGPQSKKIEINTSSKEENKTGEACIYWHEHLCDSKDKEGWNAVLAMVGHNLQKKIVQKQ